MISFPKPAHMKTHMPKFQSESLGIIGQIVLKYFPIGCFCHVTGISLLDHMRDLRNWKYAKISKESMLFLKWIEENDYQNMLSSERFRVDDACHLMF